MSVRAPGSLLRGLVAVVPAAVALALWRPGHDVFLTVKATLMVLGALALVFAALVALARSGRVVLPPRPLAAALGAYVAALVLATAAAQRPLLAVAGRAGRHVGLATSLAAVVLLLAAAVAFRGRRPTAVVVAVLGAAVPVIGYGLLQAAGADPLSWRLVEGGPPVFSTLGNANFLSAWLGIVVPLGAWAALAAPWRPWWRAAAGVIAVLALLTAALSGSGQGVVAALVGLAVLLLGWGLSRPNRLRGLATTAALLASAALAAVAAAPAEPVARAIRSLALRAAHWETAWRMAAEHPWRGVGLAGFGGWFRLYEDPEAAAARGLERGLDSPHNVPLELLATGGWPLLLGWLAVLAAITWSVVRAWPSASLERRLLLAALAGAWVAYLLQSLVSIDVAPLSALGWTVAGLIVGTAEPPAEAQVPRRAARPFALALLLALSPLAVAAVAPLRADLAAARGLAAEAADDPDTAREALADARGLAPWEPRYPSLQGAFLNRHGQREAALAAYEEAHRRDPRAVTPLLNIARLALATADDERARQAYDEAVRVAPHTPEVRAEADAQRP